MRRREFLIASSMGVAFAAAGVRAASAPGNVWTSRGTGVPPADVYAVVYEPRYAVSSAFAEEYAKRGIQVFRADDCMVRLWRGPLAQARSGGAIRIAGTTLYSDFAIARDCARDLGFTVLGEEWLKAAPVTLVNWLIGTV